VNAATHNQIRVGGVHDCIDTLQRDIALHEFDVAVSVLDLHKHVPSWLGIVSSVDWRIVKRATLSAFLPLQA
jgi:hypothetical protein